MMKLRKLYMRIPKSRWGKQAFILNLRKNARLLDVGCVNNSAYYTKILAPSCHYTGIDVGDYNNSRTSKQLMDAYHVVKDPMQFAEEIKCLEGAFDAVISSHNIEHCNKPEETTDAMCKKLARGGLLYMAFPQEKTADFPHRGGTLNFYDDPTHIYMPDPGRLIHIMKKNGMEIIFAKRGYRPAYYFLLGGILEPFSRIKNKTMPGTYSFWGFETVIWAKKK